MINEKVVLLNNNAKLPTRGTQYAAGKDLYCPVDTVLPAGKITLIKTGIAIEWDNSNYYLKIEDKSSIALKGIFVKGGIVDYDYRQEIGVILYNSTSEDFFFKAGQKCAQYIYSGVAFSNTEVVTSLSSCEDSNRTGGFGSTGQF
jgi:dUTP pyrophosphatase